MNTNLNLSSVSSSSIAASVSAMISPAFAPATAFSGSINDMALQHLLGTKNEREIAEFEQTTGWSWLDACITSLEAQVEHGVAVEDLPTGESFEDKFERITGWNLGEAIDFAAEQRREDRLFTRH